jgi:hypothetical protein
MTDVEQIQLHEQFRVLKQERDELGAMNKIKKNCGPELARYISRLQHFKDFSTEKLDRFPIAGDELVIAVQEAKTTRKVLNKLMYDLENVEELYTKYGEEMAKIQLQLKKNTKPPQLRGSAVLPVQ